MTTDTNNQNESKGNTPSHIAFHVEEREGDAKNIWTQVGALWPHKDGKGFNLMLKLQPMDGKLTIREYEPKTEQATAEQAAA